MPEATKTFALLPALSDESAENNRLRSLRRLRQLAGEIQDALRRGDFTIVSQASGLLAPALSQWAEARLPHDEHNVEVALLMEETRQALVVCETSLSRALSDVQEQQGQVRQHQKRVRQAHAQKIPLARSAGRTLNLCK